MAVHCIQLGNPTVQFRGAVQWYSTMVMYIGAVQRCSASLPCSTMVQQVVQYNGGVQWCSTMVQCGAVQRCSSAVQRCGTTVQYSSAVQRCNAAVQASGLAVQASGAVVQYNGAVVQYNCAVYRSIPTMQWFDTTVEYSSVVQWCSTSVWCISAVYAHWRPPSAHAHPPTLYTRLFVGHHILEKVLDEDEEHNLLVHALGVHAVGNAYGHSRW